MASQGFFYKLRLLALLLVLFAVAMSTWLTRLRTTAWDQPLWVVVYPINGDRSSATQRYIDGLTEDSFDAIEQFFEREGARYGIGISDPVAMKLSAQVNDLPPHPPHNGQPLAVAWWSLKMRYWAWRHDNFDGPTPDVRMYVVYHDPRTHQRLQHSLGLQKGLIGVVNAFASTALAGRNNVVIAHEFLHTVGATDK
ncbi:MAG TPA: hypothetical protein ENK05_09885, partial [Gammaproteobacteria bacterium]|nr:hypothetical protein [Gammaproteobacteria bacterium]